MNVLSLFDGISCGQVALERSGIKVDNYFASETDKSAIKITQKNFPNTIQLGDVRGVTASNLPKIDLIIGGSPCTGFSFMGRQLNFEDPQSELFFEFVRLKNELKPKHFLLENVKMKKEYELTISRYMNIDPIEIDSQLLSAQRRRRLYWTNINSHPYGLFGDIRCEIPNPKDRGILLIDILEREVSEKYYITSQKQLHYIKNPFRIRKKYTQINGRKALTQTAKMYSNWTGDYILEKNGRIRRLTPIESERLQTLPDGYTSSVLDSHRYKMIGNAWTVDVISHIFNYL